jgi:integrase
MASIYARQKNAEGKWRYIRVNIGPGRRPADLGGPFYLRVTIDGREQWVSVGDTLDIAREEAKKYQATLEAEANGLVVENDSANRLRTKIEAFNAETKANKAYKTALAYANTLRYFAQSCKRLNVEDIKREDLLTFKTHLRNEKLSERSIYNNFLNTMVFLKWCGVNAGVKKNDWPPLPEREPEEYSDEELVALLNAADNEKKVQLSKHARGLSKLPHWGSERLLLNSFLCTGLRSGELAHLTYGDIDFKHSVWTVAPKDGWKAKTTKSQRDVPVPAWLTKKIHDRMIAGNRQKSDLIFPNGEDRTDEKLLKVVKRVAKRAKVTGRVDDHKFRSTAITRWLRDGNSVADVMAWVGHTSLDTILRYAAKVNVRKAETLKKAANTFAQFASVGD